MALSVEQIKDLLEWFVNSSVQNKKWMDIRKEGLEENYKWIQPEIIKSLSDKELEERFLSYYKSGTGNRQRLNQVNRDRIIRDKAKFRNTVTYLLDESIGIEERLNQVLKGDYHIKGFGRAIATALLMDFDPKKYCLWNNKTEMGFDVLGLEVYEKTYTAGEAYIKVLEALNSDDPDETILYYGGRGVFENEGDVIFINKWSGPDQKSFRLPMGKYWQIKNEYTDLYPGPDPEAGRWLRVDENYFK